MPRHLPPLSALRAFEAAARHLSFTRGGRELEVTQAAVSHQIRALEAYLGVKLFRRLSRGLVLTDSGQEYFTRVRDAFERLERATARLRRHETSGRLTVSVLPSFAARWLVPRLGRFRERHPSVDVHLAPDERLVDFASGAADVAVRYGGGSYRGLESLRLLEEELFPVASPRLFETGVPLGEPSDLRYHTLLHDELPDSWKRWLLAAGVEDVDPTPGPTYSDSSHLVQAAVEGQGVALARSVLAEAELRAGRLVRLFDQPLPSEFAYYLVYPETSAALPKVAAFRAWILEESGAAEPIESDLPSSVPQSTS